MDDTITRRIVYRSHPPNGIYFIVRVDYNHEHPVFGGNMQPGEALFSSPIGTFDEALAASDDVANRLFEEKFDQGILTEVDPDETGGYHYYIMDQQDGVIACIGIDKYDYRKETIH